MTQQLAPPAPKDNPSTTGVSWSDRRDAERDGLLGNIGARKVVAIGGGKGGVGKSLLAANLGIFLAQLGRRTLLLDADLGGANLHTFVGVERPQVTLADLVARRVSRVEECVVETAISGLGLLAGEGDPTGLADPREAAQRLAEGLQGLDVDFLICDLAPGAGPLALDLFLAAHTGLLVVVPEPTSAENVYRFIKSAFLRRLRTLAMSRKERDGLEKVLQLRGHASEGNLPSPLDLREAARTLDPALLALLEAEMARFRPGLVVNQIRTRADLELGIQMRSAGRRRLGLPVDYVGAMDSDDAVLSVVRKRRPLVVEYPESKVAKGIERIARKLLSDGERPPLAPPRRTEEQSLYEVLEVEPGASDEEIRRAARRMRDTYSADSMVLCGLYSPENLQRVLRRVEEAYDTLLDRDRRRRYDLQLFPDGIPPDSRPRRQTPDSGELKPTTDPKMAAAAAAMEVPAPEITPETEFSGDILQRLRLSKGLELEEIAARTKIGLPQLRAIEGEAWEALPAPVYLRGFLMEYARCLRLDAGQVARSYLERSQRAAQKSPEQSGRGR